MTNRREVLGGAGVLTLVSVAGCLSSEDENGDEKQPEETGTSQSNDDRTLEDISQQYSLGLSSIEGGKAGIDNGIMDFNIEMYDRAADSFGDAVEAFERAENQFSEAIDLTYEISNSEARGICERGESHAATLRNAAEQYQQAANAAENDRGAEIVNSRLEQAESLETEADQSPPRDQSTLDSVLGLN